MNQALLARHDHPVPRYTSYPTAPHFHPGVGGAAYGQWLGTLQPTQPVSFYVHVPFCAQLCWYCGCHTKIVNSYYPIGEYARLLLHEIALVADRIPFRAPVSHIHFGGGTPTMLANADFAKIMEAIRARFAVASDAEIAVEIDPRTCDARKAEALADAGVKRASLGVQDLGPTVQQAVNRIQPPEVTERVVHDLRAFGITKINIDLIYGLPHQTVEGVVGTVDRVATLAPDRLAVFGYAHVPWMKSHQKLIDERALPDGPARMKLSQAIAWRLVGHGYRRIGLDHFARPDDGLARALDAGRLRRNFQGYTDDRAEVLLGFGASAIGDLPQGYVQNATPFRDYREAIQDLRPAVVRGIALDDDDRRRRAVIERLMCDLFVDLTAIEDEHGPDPDGFADELAALEPLIDDGLVAVDGRCVRVSELGQPFVRTVAAFFDRYLHTGRARHSRAV